MQTIQARVINSFDAFKFQRRWSLLLTLLLLSGLPAARAQLLYTTNNGAITITGYGGPSAPLVLPSTISGYPVVAIGDRAFNGLYGNVAPTTLTIPNSVTNIGGSVFDLDFGLTSISIGTGVVNITSGTFLNCYSLTQITVAAGNPIYSSLNGVLFDHPQTALIQYPQGITATNYTIPGTVTNIQTAAFEEAPLQAIVIPNSVVIIGSSAFESDTLLTTVTLGTNLTTISDNAFDDCTSLQNLTLPNSLANIGFATFYSCGLTQIIIPANVTNIDVYAFGSCADLTSVILYTPSANLGDSAFDSCYSLTGAYFAGSPPAPSSPDSTVFTDDTNAVAYYLPGATGWGATYDAIPTALWLPRLQSANPHTGSQSSQFGFNISWVSGRTVVVDATTSLTTPNWQPISTNTTAVNPVSFSDTQSKNYLNRFYRVHSP